MHHAECIVPSPNTLLLHAESLHIQGQGDVQGDRAHCGKHGGSPHTEGHGFLAGKWRLRLVTIDSFLLYLLCLRNNIASVKRGIAFNKRPHLVSPVRGPSEWSEDISFD